MLPPSKLMVVSSGLQPAGAGDAGPGREGVRTG